MKPSDLNKFPLSSVLQKCEAEVIAQNIMTILARTGNKFRKLSWLEYKRERLKDGGFTEFEKIYFTQVVDYCKSAKKAKTFSNEWNINNL